MNVVAGRAQQVLHRQFSNAFEALRQAAGFADDQSGSGSGSEHTGASLGRHIVFTNAADALNAASSVGAADSANFGDNFGGGGEDGGGIAGGIGGGGRYDNGAESEEATGGGGAESSAVARGQVMKGQLTLLYGPEE